MGVFRELYTIKLSGKYENSFRDMRLNDDYLIIGLEEQYMANQKNNATKISSVAMHVGMVDMHTFSLGHVICY